METTSQGFDMRRMLQGTSRELLVCVDLLDKGFDVFRNVCGAGCDLVCQKNDLVFFVEVKTINGKPRPGKTCRTKGTLPFIPIYGRQLKRCDVAAAVDDEKHVWYVVKSAALEQFKHVYGPSERIHRLERMRDHIVDQSMHRVVLIPS